MATTPRKEQTRPGRCKATTTKEPEAAPVRPRFLVVGDDEQIRQTLQSVFDEPYNLTRAASPADALRALARDGADVVLLDKAVLDPSSLPIGHHSAKAVAPVVWMAVDLQAVKVVGEMLKALAEARSHVTDVPARTHKAAEYAQNYQGGQIARADGSLSQSSARGRRSATPHIDEVECDFRKI